MNVTIQEEQLSPEQLFTKYEKLAYKTLHLMFPNANNFAESKGLEFEDLLQYSLMGLWKGCQTFHTTTHKRGLRSFLIQNIRWYIQVKVRDEGVTHLRWKSKPADEDNTVILMSLDSKPTTDHDDNDTFHDLIGHDYSLEGEAIGKLLTKMIENKYPDRTVTIIKMRSEGMNNNEIGKVLGLSRERVRQILNQVRNELKGVI